MSSKKKWTMDSLARYVMAFFLIVGRIYPIIDCFICYPVNKLTSQLIGEKEHPRFCDMN